MTRYHSFSVFYRIKKMFEDMGVDNIIDGIIFNGEIVSAGDAVHCQGRTAPFISVCLKILSILPE